MSQIFCVHLYTMGSREYVQQALHHLDPHHRIFKPGQVLAWNPALDRTTKTLQRLLCHPQLVLIVDDSPAAWSQHLGNLLLIDRFTGSADDTSLPRIGAHLKEMHAAFFAMHDAQQRQLSLMPPPPTPSSQQQQQQQQQQQLQAPCEDDEDDEDDEGEEDSDAGLGDFAMAPVGQVAGEAPPIGPLVTPVLCPIQLPTPGAEVEGEQAPETPTDAPVKGFAVDTPEDGVTAEDGAETDADAAAEANAAAEAEASAAASAAAAGQQLAQPASDEPTAADSSTGATSNGVLTVACDVAVNCGVDGGGGGGGRRVRGPMSARVPSLPPPLPSVPEHAAVQNGGEGSAASPDVRELLSGRCAPVLGGVDCVITGPSALLLAEGRVPPEVQLARRFGVTLRAELAPTSTHLLVPPSLLGDIATNGSRACERTQLLLQQAHDLGLLDKLQLVDLRWLLDSLAQWRRLPEEDYAIAMAAAEDDGEEAGHEEAAHQ